MTTDNGTTDNAAAGRDSFFANRTATVALTLLVIVYVAFFCATSFMTYRDFGMSAYDIGIHDQALWKLSTLRGFFNTIRGMNIWGDHVWIIMAVIAPLYRIVPRLETLLAVQTVALAAGAFPLAAYAYRRIGSRPVALLLAAAFLLSPALQNMNLENAHPEVLAVPFILWMIAAAEVDSWPAYGIALLLALFCKEDLALTTFAVGFYVFFRRSRRAGVVTMLLSVAYFIICMKLILPYANGSGFFRFQSGYWFSDFWAHKFDVRYYASILSRPGVGQYAWKLSFPLLGLFLLDPLLLLAAIPGFVINVLSGNVYLVGIDYHYNYHTLPILFATTASGISVMAGWVRPRRTPAIVIALLILTATLAANITWSQAPVTIWGTRLNHQWRQLQEDRKWSRFEQLIALLPTDPDIPIAASHNLVPALAHRTEIYMLPNPWKVYYWGIAGEKRPAPDRVEWLVLDSRSIDKEIEPIVARLFDSGEFCKVAEDGDWVVAKRNAPSGAAGRIVTPWSGDLLNVVPPERGIRARVFASKTVLTSLRPLFGRKPDFEIVTDALLIPETQGVLAMSDGQSLKASDNVRVVFSGAWRARGREETQFRVRADDGCRLYLDGNMVIDYNGTHAFGAKAVSKPLRLGKGPHVIVVDYFEWGGAAGLSVEWKAAGGHFEQLQSGALLP
ncbi:MAG: DUF2079 domain-containing protein [Proteobacteria bacterium]|nr:DUF2079 domain-containing protein [Pseudomonadota bacterium]